MNAYLPYLLMGLVLVVLVANTIISLWKYSWFSKPLKLFTFMILVNLFTEITSNLLRIYNVNNLPLLHLYTLLEFILLSLFYRSIIQKPDWLKQNFNIFVGLVILLQVLNSIFLQDIYSFNSNSKTLTNLSFITFGIIYIFNSLTEKEAANHQAIKLINSALLFYYISSLFIFLFSTTFIKYSYLLLGYMWTINISLNLIFQILIFIALTFYVKNPQRHA